MDRTLPPVDVPVNSTGTEPAATADVEDPQAVAAAWREQLARVGRSLEGLALPGGPAPDAARAPGWLAEVSAQAAADAPRPAWSALADAAYRDQTARLARAQLLSQAGAALLGEPPKR